MFSISLNQYAMFSIATEKGKIGIVRQQLKPNPFKIQWYQLARGSMKRSIQRNGDLKPIVEAIKKLQNRKPANNRQLADKNVSIEALYRYIRMKLPEVFRTTSYVIVKPEIKTTTVAGVNVIVAADVIVRFEAEGKSRLGAIKIHCAKRAFNYQQSLDIATILYKYLREIKAKDEIVDPNLCFSLDIFGDRIVSAPVHIQEALKRIEKNCNEIQEIAENL